MVRRAAAHATQQLVQAAAQTHTQQDRPQWRWPPYIKLAEALCSLLTAAPDSPLAAPGLQQVTMHNNCHHVYNLLEIIRDEF